jgi:hypothetical protein
MPGQFMMMVVLLWRFPYIRRGPGQRCHVADITEYIGEMFKSKALKNELSYLSDEGSILRVKIPIKSFGLAANSSADLLITQS